MTATFRCGKAFTAQGLRVVTLLEQMFWDCENPVTKILNLNDLRCRIYLCEEHSHLTVTALNDTLPKEKQP
jgi:hypothetical protein